MRYWLPQSTSVFTGNRKREQLIGAGNYLLCHLVITDEKDEYTDMVRKTWYGRIDWVESSFNRNRRR